MADDGGRRGHQDRPQTRFGSLDDRGQLVPSRLLQVVGEIHDQNAVLRDQADQGDQPDLAVDVQRRQAEKRERQGSRDGQRHRACQDDERIAKALELCREDQIDQDRGQKERAQETAPFRAELTRLAGVIDREPSRQQGTGFVLEEPQRAIQRHVRGNHALHSDRVELLELLQLARLGGRAQGGERRERHERIMRLVCRSAGGGASDVDLRELVGCQTVSPLDLRNHLVASPLDAEPIYVVAAEKRREIQTRLAQLHALRSQLVAIEDDLRLRLIELQIGIGVDEEAARERLLHQLPGDVSKLLRLRRRRDHQIHREVSASGKRRGGERDGADTRDLRERAHQSNQQLLRALRPLAPGLRHQSPESGRRERDLENTLGLGEGPVGVVNLGSEELRLVDGRIRGCLNDREDDALILGGRELPLREQVKRHRQQHHDRPQHEHHRPVAERA